MTDEPTGAESVEEAPASTEALPTTTTESPDFSRLYERMDDMGRQVASVVERLSQPQDEETEEEEMFPGDEGYEEWEAQKALDEYLERKLQEKLEPERAQRLKERRDEEWEALLEELPELQDSKISGPVIQKARDLASALNPEAINRPELVDLIELVYKAQKADERAAREKPAGERREVHLEGAGGVAPQEPEEDPQDRLIKVHQERKQLI